MDDCLALTLLRHGMTAENQRSAYIGWTDSPLSEKGKAQAKCLHAQLPKMDLVFSSDLRRCLETTAILFPDQSAQQLEEIRELNFGFWEGKTYAELKHLPAYRHWLDHLLTARPDGGETFAEFGDRIKLGFAVIKKQIHASGAKESTIVTHGGVIRFLMSLAGGNESFFDWEIPYVGGYRLFWTEDGLRRGETCMSLQAVPTTENLPG